MKYVIANWKMHGRSAFVDSWCLGFPSGFQALVNIVVAPPAVYLGAASNLLPVGFTLAAQDVSVNMADGAHTGEVSALMLKDIGCSYVIVGHSERRAAGDTPEKLARKLANICEAGLTPVFCVGEPMSEREQGNEWAFVKQQLSLLDKYPDDKPLLIAYEPIWAIGTGVTAKVDDVIKMHTQIKNAYARPVLYGGSVNARNANELMAIDVVDGALVGGASLKPDEFLSIVDAAA